MPVRATFARLSSALALFACVFSPAAHANDSDFQAWSALAISGPATQDSRFLLWFDGHARFRDDASELGTSIIRPGIGWKATDKVNLWAGYARVTGHRDGLPDIEEDRAWQQATYPITEIFGGRLSGRTRFEQRFRSDLGDDTGYRLRQFNRWARPIEGTDWSYVVANETFLGLNNTDWGQRDGFDQNRAFLGLAWKAAPKARVEFGYLNNHINGAVDDQTNHNVSAALFLSLN